MVDLGRGGQVGDEGLELLGLSVVVVSLSTYFVAEVCERSVERLVVVDGAVQSVAEFVLEVALTVLFAFDMFQTAGEVGSHIQDVVEVLNCDLCRILGLEQHGVGHVRTWAFCRPRGFWVDDDGLGLVGLGWGSR